MKMRRRVFLAINLDTRTLGEIEKLADDCKRLLPAELLSDARFLELKNWHITLSFLGYQDDDVIAKIVRILKEAAQQFLPQKVMFEKLLYGPLEQSPRMIWIAGTRETSAHLAKIKDVFEDRLEEHGVVFRRENRQFHAHLTLARFEKSFKRSNLPAIERLVAWQFEAQSLDLMESELKRGGAEYIVLQKFPFGR